MVYALGFTLEKVAAMQEHGIKGVPWSQDLHADIHWAKCISREHGYTFCLNRKFNSI